MSTSDPRDALSDIVHCLATVFKKYDRKARKTAWKSLNSTEGEKLIEKILDSPTRPIIGLPKLLKFKEWLSSVKSID
jgi:hypothetical protein